MHQSKSVLPLSGLQVSTDNQQTSGRLGSPQPSQKKQEREKSAPPCTIVNKLLESKAKRKSENGTNDTPEVSSKPADEEYKTVPISYISPARAHSPIPTHLSPKATKPPILPSLRSRSIRRSRPSSVDSELPLTQETLKQPSNLQGSASFESEIRISCSKLAVPWFVTKNPSETGITISEDLAGENRMKESNKARSILMTTDVKPGIVEMATSVPVNYPVLDLSEQDLHDEDLSHIIRLLEVYPFATQLDLFGNKLAFSNCKGVTFGRAHPCLQQLVLSKNSLGPLSAHGILGRFLTTFPSLLVLDLAGCGLTDEDLFRLSADFIIITSLRSLNLSENLLTNEVSTILGQILDSNKAITRVDLSRMSVTSKIKSTLRRHKRKLVLDRGKRCCEACRVM